MVRNKTAHVSLHRRQHLQILFGQRSEIHRNQHCEQFSSAVKRVWQSSALASPTKTLNTDLAPNADDVEPIKAAREDVEVEIMNTRKHWKQRLPEQE